MTFCFITETAICPVCDTIFWTCLDLVFRKSMIFSRVFCLTRTGRKTRKRYPSKGSFLCSSFEGNNKQSLLGKGPGSLTLICSSCLSDISAVRDVQSGPDGAKDEKMNMRDGFMTPRWSELKAVQP